MDASTEGIEIVRAAPTAARAVLRRCLFRPRQSPVELERHVNSIIEYARALSIDLGRLWTVRRNGQDMAGGACIVSPGRSAMLILPPGTLALPGEAALMALARRMAHELFQEDVCLLQALLDEDDEIGRRVLSSIGFHEIALLHYLEKSLEREPSRRMNATPPSPGRIGWRTYSAQSHADFARTIQDSYIDSLDCPGLSRLRTIEDVIEGHKAAGLFNPSRWRLLTIDDEPVACILLSQNPLRPVLEIVYMGVRPQFRRRSTGGFLLGSVLQEAYHERFQAVTLAVDGGNEPGRRLYARHGFQETARRRAMILARSEQRQQNLAPH